MSTKTKKRIRAEKIIDQCYDSKAEFFDYPDYGGLNQRTAYTLSSEFVDVVQDEWDVRRQMSKAKWRSSIIAGLKALGASEL